MEDLKYFASTNVILETQIISIFKVKSFWVCTVAFKETTDGKIGVVFLSEEFHGVTRPNTSAFQETCLRWGR